VNGFNVVKNSVSTVVPRQRRIHELETQVADAFVSRIDDVVANSLNDVEPLRLRACTHVLRPDAIRIPLTFTAISFPPDVRIPFRLAPIRSALKCTSALRITLTPLTISYPL
jgi:hypothetical protein